MTPYDNWVADLAVKHRAKDAFWRLVLSGPAALPAVRRGLVSDNDDIRVGCTKVLDHLVDEESWPELIAMIDDANPDVRMWTLHSLACDRCKESGCALPERSEVLPPAIRALESDPDQHVRQMAVGVIAQWMYDDADAAAALRRAHEADPHPAVRKKAGWFIPGGARYERLKPRAMR
ncbi:MAG TPA: HEAT repeat domain-containing protein [Acidimicrobiales bacterium]|nr:HEAT repeat domain-containing protein [Acidimicrobiales bacterium]